MKILTRNLVIKTLQYKASNGTDFFNFQSMRVWSSPTVVIAPNYKKPDDLNWPNLHTNKGFPKDRFTVHLNTVNQLNDGQ